LKMLRTDGCTGAFGTREGILRGSGAWSRSRGTSSRVVDSELGTLPFVFMTFWMYFSLSLLLLRGQRPQKKFHTVQICCSKGVSWKYYLKNADNQKIVYQIYHSGNERRNGHIKRSLSNRWVTGANLANFAENRYS